ncbi:MAG: FAD-dependent oxidoreductase [Lachnospiraceae bacterium]
MYSQLFSPIKIGSLELKNRIIMPAMGTRMADENSFITEKLIAYHKARALGGSGLNIVEVASVHTKSAPAHFVSISDDQYIEGHRKLCDAIHQGGGKAGIQLWQGSIAVSMDPKAQILVASDMPFGAYTLPGITKEQIDEIVQCYGAAAKRAASAGYDCVEFHCAHNYLPHSFLSKGLNHRSDEYGGSLQNRAKFPLACIHAIKENLPEGMPIFMRIDAHDDYLQEGLTIEEVIAFCSMAKEAGVTVLDISRGNIITAASLYEVPPIDIPNGFNVDNAARIRKETGMLTIAVGRINTPDFAETILSQEKADLVVMGRAQLADPEFCNKAKAGNVEDITYCVGCNQGCYDGFCDVVNFPHITCMRNPMLGHEGEDVLKKTEHPKKILIAGGGMGGIETALIAKQKGHNPVIYDTADSLGGQFLTAGEAPGKAEMKEAAKAFAHQVVTHNINVHLHSGVTKEVLEKEQPQEVVIAIGASPIALQLEHMNEKPYYDAHEILKGTCNALGSVCVIGGGLVGLETADKLAEQGHRVCVLEMLGQAGADLGSLRKIAVLQKMAMQKVTIVTEAACVGFCKEGVIATKDGKEEIFACDSVVIAAGARANSSESIILACEELGIPYHIIGDAKKARRALNAIHEGFNVAINL